MKQERKTGISVSDSTADGTLFEEGSRTTNNSASPSFDYEISNDISEVPIQRSEVFVEHDLILEEPFDELSSGDPETSKTSQQRKPFFLVPEYDLTPSPHSSPLEVSRRNSCSPIFETIMFTK